MLITIKTDEEYADFMESVNTILSNNDVNNLTPSVRNHLYSLADAMAVYEALRWSNIYYDKIWWN